MRPTPTDQGFALTAMLVTLTVSIMVVAGLVVDGGRLIAARRDAMNASGSAGRLALQPTGHQGVGTPSADPGEARRVVSAYLSARGFPDHEITLICEPRCTRAEVTARTHVTFRLGRLLGVAGRDVEVVSVARTAQGISEEE